MKKNLTIIQMNDTHGYLDSHWELFWDGAFAHYKKAGGYARIASYLKKVRNEKNNHVLFLDGGDTFHGTHPVVNSKGEILIDLLNDLKVDAMSAHWDFAYGPKQLNHILSKLNYPLLAINCYDKETDELAYDPYIIKDINGLKVAIIGIAANIIDKVMPKHFSEGLYFTLGNHELPNIIKEVKEQDVDLVLVLSHLGFPQEVKLAQDVPVIDILLSVHTYNRIYEPIQVDDTIIIQSGCHGSFLGHLDLVIEDKKIIEYRHHLQVLDETVEEDIKMKKKVIDCLSHPSINYDEVLGKTNTDLNRNTILESTMDNFLLSAMIDQTGADIAFSNGWRYGAPIPKGAITRNDLWNIIPVNPNLETVILSGQELWDMMEENFTRTFAHDAYEQMGGYVKRGMGINLYFKIENPPGKRIQQFFVGGSLIDKEKEYNVVFVTTQGVPSKYGHTRIKTDINAIDSLENYLKRHKAIDAELKGSIVAV